ncbi:MAG: hypothetical protein AAF548_06345 [Actinomycetota bacterium]
MAGGDQHALDVHAFVREFERVRRGYDPAAVDHHLALIKSQVQIHLERAVDDPDESLDLVLRATRRSVDEALQDARERADAIIAASHAEAAEIRAAAATDAAALQADSRERYDEMGRLTAQRRRDLAALEAEIADHATRIRSLAGGLTASADRLDSSPTQPSGGMPTPIAAMQDDGIEVRLPAEREPGA